MIEKIIKDYYKENQSKRLVMCNLSNLLKDNADFQEFKNTKLGFIKDPTDTQVFWHVLNDDYRDNHYCLNCGNENAFNRQFFYHDLCSRKCTAIYSAKNFTVEQKEEMIRKREETNTIKYGARYSSMTEEGKQKKIETCLKTYGVENPMQNKEVHDRQFKSMQDSNMENYGVKSTLSIKEVYDKTTATKIELYGEDYGKIIFEKTKATCLEKYGFEFYTQTPGFFEKFLNHDWGNKYKDYVMPSGKIARIQGYEDKALNILLKTKTEDEISIGPNIFKAIGKIQYELDGLTKIYKPDIYLPNENKIIEVKSGWTFSVELEMNFAKAHACKELGFNFEFWIFDRKGNLEIITV